MDAVTYSKEDVIATVQELFVPVKLDGTKETEVVKHFRAEVTPIALATDSKRKTFYRKEGFIPPEDFKQIVRLMAACFYLDRRKYDAAIALLTQILDEAFGSAATPESLYLLGVAKYKKSGDFQLAVEQWRRLKLTYPNHPLIKKVDYAL